MTNSVLNTLELPSILNGLIRTEKVIIEVTDDGVIRIVPVREGSGFRGIAKTSKFSTEKLLAYRREDKERGS